MYVSPDGHHGAVEFFVLPVGEQLRDGRLLPASFKRGRTECHLFLSGAQSAGVNVRVRSSGVPVSAHLGQSSSTIVVRESE